MAAPAPTTTIKLDSLDVPILETGFKPADVLRWLNACGDAFESYEEQPGGARMDVKRKVRAAGMRMRGEGAVWWDLRREELKALGTWEEFVAEAKARFLPGGWEMEALHAFYGIRQTTDFPSFAAALLDARNKVRGNITDNILKAHLLHLAHNTLYLRVTANPAFTLATLSVDQLVSHMSTLWAGLVAEGRVRAQPASLARASPPSASSSIPAPAGRHPLLTDDLRATLRAQGRCFKCRKPGHGSSTCPGDPAHGVVASISQVKQEDPPLEIAVIEDMLATFGDEDYVFSSDDEDEDEY
jgi:hypothetical protein